MGAPTSGNCRAQRDECTIGTRVIGNSVSGNMMISPGLMEAQMVGSGWDRVPIDSQSIDAPLSRAAVFLTLTVAEGREALQTVADV